MEAPLQAQYGAPLEPLGFGLTQPTAPLYDTEPESSLGLSTELDYLHGTQFSPNGTSASESAGSSTTINSASAFQPEEEEESLVDSQSICFSENPFLVANRKGNCLSGPPVGYGRQGQLQPWLFSKARCLPACLRVVWRRRRRRKHAVLLTDVICKRSQFPTCKEDLSNS